MTNNIVWHHWGGFPDAGRAGWGVVELENHRDISDFKSLVYLLISYINKFSSSPHSPLLPVKWDYLT